MDTIIGNKNQRDNLKKIIRTGNIGHAYMFVGQEGIGKSMIAREFAKTILCENPTDTFCGRCECCDIFENSPDFVFVSSNEDIIKVGEIRELSENIILKPVKSNHRVFIINNADRMNESAQNALLKILEEPPTYAIIILILSNKEKILKTIQSRCVEIYFNSLSFEEIKSFYEGQEINPELFKYARGSIGKLEKLKNTNYIENVIELEKALSFQNLLEMNQALNKIKENKNVKENMQDVLELLIIKLNSELKENYEKKIMQIEIIEECKKNLKRNANFDITLDYMMIKLWEMA